MYMYVCLYIYIYILKNIYTCYIDIHWDISMYIYIYIDLYIYIYIYIYIVLSIYIYIHTYTHMNIYFYTYIYVYVFFRLHQYADRHCIALVNPCGFHSSSDQTQPAGACSMHLNVWEVTRQSCCLFCGWSFPVDDDLWLWMYLICS